MANQIHPNVARETMSLREAAETYGCTRQYMHRLATRRELIVGADSEGRLRLDAAAVRREVNARAVSRGLKDAS